MSEEPKRPTILGRLGEALMNKVFEAIVLVVVGIVMVFFGYPHVFEKLGFSNPVADFVEAEEAEASGEAPAIVKKDVPEQSLGVTVADSNVGYHRKSKYFGASSKFLVMGPGEHEAPFTELKSGVHDLPWSVHLTSEEGGLWGIGSKDTEWQVKGVMTAEFEQNSYYSLLEDGEENFLTECLLPLIAKAGQNVLDQSDMAALLKEHAGPAETGEDSPEVTVVAEVSDPAEFSVEAEQTESEIEKFSKRLTEETNRLLDEKYSVHVENMQVDEMRILKKADLSDPQLDSLTSVSMFRQAMEPVTKLDTFRYSSSGGVLSFVMFIVFVGVGGLFVFNLLH